MADVKISQLPAAATPLIGNEIIPLVQNSTTVNTSVNNISAAAISISANFTANGVGAIPRTVQSKLQDTVSVKDFGAVGDGVTDDTAAIRAAINAVSALGGGTVNFVNGETYLVSGIILLKTNVSLIGNGCTISVNPLNYTGGVPRFYGVFSTVNIINRPLTILWRIGNGVIAFENIVIDGFTFEINRDGNVLTTGQMDVAEINVVRFEDARNCKVTNCRFIDGETALNNNGNPVVFFVRSYLCEISNCYANDTTLLEVVECTQCTIADNYIAQSVGTSIEVSTGASNRVINNRIDATWWGVSSIGINSRQCVITGNVINESALTGITIGHPTPTGGANFYNLPLDANFSTCNENYVLSGSNYSSSHGYIGILVQSATYVTIADNVILNLRKKTAYTDRAGGVLVQPDAADTATGLRIEKNRLNVANNGIHIVRGESIVVNENSISDVYAGFYFESAVLTPRIVLANNLINTSDRGIVISNGYAEITGNYIASIANANFAFTFARGYFRFENNFLSECGLIFFSQVKSVVIIGNVIENAVPITNAITIDNGNVAGTATINNITVLGNIHPGSTNMVRITNVLNQTTRTLEFTSPIQFRSTSYNVGSLPTATTGLATGDLWNDAGTVKVV